MAGSEPAKDWRRLEELFFRALDLPPGERVEFLNAACGDDAALRKRLESMLASESQPPDFLSRSLEQAAQDILETADPTFAEGAILGPYRIDSLLGAGGMGRVYLAHDSRLDRDVAIKTLAPDAVRNPKAVELFQQEARAASALNHPNILTIYEAGEHASTRFLVTEYVDGVTLAARLSASSMDAASAVEIAIQVASGLVAAHAAGIIHRDIKPENLLVRQDGLVKIVDFGIAKLSENRGSSTPTAPSMRRTGAILGTARYMSPEQARGLALDGRTDVFSLGTVLYEMLAARPAFNGDTDSDILAEILKTDPPRLDRVAPAAPPELARIVAKAMQKDREQRYATAAEMLADLKALRDDLRFRQKTRTGPLTRSAVLMAIALIAVLAGAYYLRRALSHPADNTTPRSLAVLPFRNIRPDPSTDFLGFSLADAVIAKLGSVRSLSVRPSSVVERYRNQEIDPKAAARALQVDTLLTGTYISEAGKLRINAQLVDANGLNILWRDVIDVPFENLLDVNDRVAQNIITSLSLDLTQEERESLKVDTPTDEAAYEDYLRGVDLYALNDFASSVAMLEKAAALDPKYAMTWTHLGRAYEANATLQFGGREQNRKAQEAYEKALSLNPSLVEPRVYMANLLTDTGEVERAVPLLQAALARNPNKAGAHWELGYAYRFGGLLADSVRECVAARRIDPSFKLTTSAINAYFYLGQYDAWLSSLPDSNTAYIVFYRGLGEYYRGDRSAAQHYFQQAYDLDPALLQANIGKALSYAIQGRHEAGRQLLRGVESRILDRGVTDAEGIYKVAQAYAVLGDRQAALRLFRTAIEGGFFPYPYFERDPLIDNLRGDPSFSESMEKAHRRSQEFRGRFSPRS
jgi:serine/threonine protein kinase